MLWKNFCLRNNDSNPKSAPLRETGAEVTALFEEILNDHFLLRVKVTGRSMRPFLKGGETLVIRKVKSSSLKKGDLILFKNAYDVLVIHRIVRKRMDSADLCCFETKGDALMSFDQPVSGKDVLGKVCRTEGTHSFNMESRLWGVINYLIATHHLIRSRTFFFMSGSYKALLRCRL
jgi:signal peptidase I